MSTCDVSNEMFGLWSAKVSVQVNLTSPNPKHLRVSSYFPGTSVPWPLDSAFDGCVGRKGVEHTALWGDPGQRQQALHLCWDALSSQAALSPDLQGTTDKT